MMSSFAVLLTLAAQSLAIQTSMQSTSSQDQLFSSSSDMSSNTLNKNWMELETAIIASMAIPSGISSLPFVSRISLKRILNQKPVNFFYKAFVSSMGVLCIDEHLDWIPLVRMARNCHEHNLTAHLSHNDTAVTLHTIKPIAEGEELKVWLSPEMLIKLNVPFLTLNNIINNHCYRCHQCGINYSQPNPLKIHLSFECKPKEEMFSKRIVTIQESASAAQQSINEINYRKSRELKSHTCLFCGKIYTRKYGLKIHVRTHTGQKPLRCRFCGRPFSDPSNLNKHVRLHSQQTGIQSSPYKCKLCSKVLVRRRDLERHIKSRHQ